MKFRTYLQAALLGVVLAGGTIASVSSADTLRVVRQGTSSKLSVPMNRAVVVESDIPFAELSIANPSIADISSLSDRTIYVLGKTAGTTTLTLLDASGRLITNVDVRVTPDITEFKERLRQVLPGEKIEVRTANDGLVLSGVVSSTQKMQRALNLAAMYVPQAGDTGGGGGNVDNIKRVTNLMSVGGVQQVMLKVRFAEMSRTVSKKLASSLALGGDLFGGDVGLQAGTGQAAVGTSQQGILAGGLDNSTANEASFNIGFNAGAVEVALLIEALEAKGVVRMLAEPNLTALSGQEANFLAGGEYPVPVAQEGGAIRIEYKPFGVELAFIPTVVDGDIINLELKTAVSAIDPTNGFVNNDFKVDAFTKREASTTVEMRDGESFAIAGLLQDDFTDLNGQVPWLGDVPVLGALFRSAEYRREQSELVIIVTPHLVTPTRGEALALPTDRVRPPSEKDLFLHGRVASDTGRRAKGPVAEVAKQDFSGSYGYVMD